MNKHNHQHTGCIPRFNAWLLNKGGKRYNQMTEKRKKSLFNSLSGKVLEIGPGAGTNLKYYPDDISLTGLEPNPYMQNYLKEKAKRAGRPLKIITGTAENIPLEDETIDAVVSTLVLCSVTDMTQALYEIKRVLKSGGTFLFVEHVAAPEKSFLCKVQQWIKPLWKKMADGCHTDRETWKYINQANFDNVNISHFKLPLPIVSPHIMGKAVKR